MQIPKAKKIEKKLVTHGHERVDNYYWLNDRENSEVIDYLNAENAYTKAKLEHTVKLQEELFEEIKGKIVKDDASVPYKLNGYWYYTRFEEGKDYPFYCRKKETLEADEELILDVNVLAEGQSYCALGGLSISFDNKWVCYGLDTTSRRIYRLYFKNLETGETLEETIENTAGYAVWASDSKSLFYVQLEEETLRDFKVFRHEFGTSEHVEVFHEKDDTFRVGVSKTKSKAYILIESDSTLSSEIQFLSADTPKEMFKMFMPREKDLEYAVEHHEDKFYVYSNYNAKNFSLMTCGVDKTIKEHWQTLIAHREDVLLEGFELFNDYLVLDEKRNGLCEICIMNTKENSSYYLDFGEETYEAYTTTNVEFDTEVLRYSYTSLTTPDSVIELNMRTKEKTVLKETKILGDFNKDEYESKRLWATAKDGLKIPVSIVYKKGLKLDGNNPLLQYAYGSYGYSMDDSFSVSTLSLLDRGFVYAIAHIRGGEELGRHWYEDGKLLTKMNTFTDFIACSEFLIEQGYTNSKKLFAQGGSAGGMLMGGIANMRPDLYQGVVAQVPFVDVVTTMLDDTLPLTTGEYDEWGNPNIKKYYDYMLSYSPYDNVEKKEYPNMLVTTGLHDHAVQYFEPTKWVAKLRDLKTDDNLLLLKINMDAGHGGASGRFEGLKDTALVFAFLLELVYMPKKSF